MGGCPFRKCRRCESMFKPKPISLKVCPECRKKISRENVALEFTKEVGAGE